MNELEKIEKFLKNCKKIAVVGVGNPLSPTDDVGLKMADKISKYTDKVEVTLAYNTPENILSKYLESDYTHIILIDAVKTGKKPLSITVLKTDQLPEETPTTHTVPLKLLLKALERAGKSTLILGIELPTSENYDQDILEFYARRLVDIIGKMCLS